MKLVVLAACFLFFCQHAPSHRRVHSHACATILKDYDPNDQDAFVKAFPVEQQHRVLVCIEKAKAGVQ